MSEKPNCRIFRCAPVCFCTPHQASLLLSEGKGRTLILLIRHGATDWNMEVRLQGRHNIPLNSTGMEQARITAEVVTAALGEKAAEVRVYTSPLARAKDTAAYISGEMNGMPPVELDSLIERDYGSLEGLTYSQRQRKYKCGAKYPDDMEPTDDATVRMMRAIGEVRRLAVSDTAVVVSHGGVLNLLFAHITRGRAGVSSNITANCTVSLVAAGDRDIIPLAYNLGGEELTQYLKNI